MTTTYKQLTHVLIAIGALVLAMTAATPTYAKSGHALTIKAVAVRGNEIAITVTNHTPKTQMGAVTAQALTSGGPIQVMAPVTAAAGQSVTIRVEFPERLQDEIPVGVVVDDGVPF
jgi:hypothetical protein